MTNPNCFDDLPDCNLTPAHSHKGQHFRGQVYDFYYGGTRDGQRWPLDKGVKTAEIMTPAGEVYQHHPGFDSETERAWLVVPSIRPSAANGVHVEPVPGNKHLTLQDLRTLVVTAERMGHGPDAVIYGRVAWRGQALTLGIKPAEQEGKP